MNCIRQRASAFALVLMFLALSLVFSACQDGGGGGGGGVNPEVGNPPVETGQMKISVNWPAQPVTALNGFQTTRYFIAGTTEWIRVRVKNGIYVQFADLLPPVSPSTTSSTTLTIPAPASYTVDVLAMKDGGASASGPILLSAGSTVTGEVPVYDAAANSGTGNAVVVSLTLRQSDVVFTTPAAPGPLAQGTTTPMALTFSASDPVDTGYNASATTSGGWPAGLYQAAIGFFFVNSGYPSGGTIASACSSPADTAADGTATNALVRSCFSPATVPNAASPVKLLANIDGSAYALVVSGSTGPTAGPTLYPASTTADPPVNTNFEVLSADFTLEATTGNMDIIIQ